MVKNKKSVYAILEKVTDPEIPVLSILDLGIVRNVECGEDDVHVTITPTYSGCPAMSEIVMCIKIELLAAGWKKVTVTETFSPAWTTDWMTETGKQKLRAYGIAPPIVEKRMQNLLFEKHPEVPCPQCDSADTELLSEFGSTACKSLMRCKSCLEPFDYFKCHR